MQITDMLSQYNRNIANGVEISSGTQGIKQISSSLQGLSVGNVFEGNINQVENGVVTLGLPDGKTIEARLDSGVSVRVGESMFFQVRSNNGSQIAIRPFASALGTNPTILNALDAANLQVNGKTITMVNTMMEQSMSIDKQSLIAMARLVMGNEGMDVTSIVQMEKLGIPVTEEMAAQFENYKSDQYAILDQLETVMEQLPEQLSNGSINREQLLEFNQQMLSVLLGGEENVLEGKVVSLPQESDLGQAGQVPAEALAEQADQPEAAVQTASSENMEELLKAGAEENKAQGAKGAIESPSAEDGAQAALAKAEQDGKGERPDLVRNLLTDSEWKQFSKQLSELPGVSENPAFVKNGVLRSDLSSEEVLRLLEQAILKKGDDGGKALSELLTSKEYRTLIRNGMEQQWLLKPEELKTEHKVNELYERLDRQLGQMEKVLKEFGQGTSQLSATAENVRGNIQFMNQINQIYAYVQIPLKLSGQNAHSDLYVYTDKRKKNEKDDELTAFLHLDLDHLGSTDVSIKLHQRQVATNFYLADESSYQLILEHMDLLKERLEAKGFYAQIQVINQEEKVNFVEDLLKQGRGSVGGMVHRYSFDVRA